MVGVLRCLKAIGVLRWPIATFTAFYDKGSNNPLQGPFRLIVGVATQMLMQLGLGLSHRGQL